MKTPTHLLRHFATFLTAALLMSGFTACSTPLVGEARNAGLENRQDRMNARTSYRADRIRTRSENADARSDALFDAM
jgi:hypothetical protein